MNKIYVDDKVMLGAGHLGIVTGVFYNPLNQERKIKVRLIFSSSYSEFNNKFVIVEESELKLIEEHEEYI